MSPRLSWTTAISMAFHGSLIFLPFVALPHCRDVQGRIEAQKSRHPIEAEFGIASDSQASGGATGEGAKPSKDQVHGITGSTALRDPRDRGEDIGDSAPETDNSEGREVILAATAAWLDAPQLQESASKTSEAIPAAYESSPSTGEAMTALGEAARPPSEPAPAAFVLTEPLGPAAWAQDSLEAARATTGADAALRPSSAEPPKTAAAGRNAKTRSSAPAQFASSAQHNDHAASHSRQGKKAGARASGRPGSPTSPNPLQSLGDLNLGSPGAADALLYGSGSGLGTGPDLSSPPRIGGYVYWECPWPVAADRAQIDEALVHVTVDVTAKGEPRAAHLLDDAGYDFGRDAVRCAMDQHYIPGRDANGNVVAGRTLPFSVRFNRHHKQASF